LYRRMVRGVRRGEICDARISNYYLSISGRCWFLWGLDSGSPMIPRLVT
jgi:hypothetical protein